METFKRYQNRKKLFNKTAMNIRIQVKEKYWCNCCIQKKHLTKQFTFDVKYGRLRRGLKGGEESVEGVEGSRPPYSSVSKNNEFGQRGEFSPCCRDTRTIYLVKHHLPPAFLYHPSFQILSFIHHLLHPSSFILSLLHPRFFISILPNTIIHSPSPSSFILHPASSLSDHSSVISFILHPSSILPNPKCYSLVDGNTHTLTRTISSLSLYKR